MEITKRLNLNNIFISLFFIIFPFGQILRIGILHPLDIVVGLGALVAVIKKFKKPLIFKYFETVLFIALFSWIFGSAVFKQFEIFFGVLYLLRLSAYFYFFVYVWRFAMTRSSNKKLLFDSLLSVSIISALFGWLQFFTFPDLKPFFVWGWDMHFLRLVGTFLDPTFLGLIIVFGILLSIIKLIDSKKKSNWGILLFLLFSLAFTYSRASYLALFGGFLVIASFKKFIGKALSLILVFGALMFLLPTSRNHSIELLRSISAIARIENYQTTIKIFTKSPIFGIGYDNICIAYQKFIGPGSFDSHACSGSDSSILFILATTGIAGIFVFIYFIRGVADSIVASRNKLLISATFTALFIHSIFSNSAFYPWILGWMMILLGITIKQNEI